MAERCPWKASPGVVRPKESETYTASPGGQRGVFVRELCAVVTISTQFKNNLLCTELGGLQEDGPENDSLFLRARVRSPQSQTDRPLYTS